MGRLTSRRKRRMWKLQRLKLRRTSSVHTFWWAGYWSCFIWGCILPSFCQWNWPEKMKETFLLEGWNACFGNSCFLASYWEHSLFHLSLKTVVNQCQPSVAIPMHTLVELDTSPVQVEKSQDRLVSLLRIQGPSELQDFACLNPDCKGEATAGMWEQRAWNFTAKSSMEVERS